MKKVTLMISLLPVLAFAQSQDQNYIKTTQYKIGTTASISSPALDQAVQNITYVDGLGRPIQQIEVGQSAAGKSIISHIEYDAFGRQTRDFLSYPSGSADQAYDSGAATAVADYYANPPSPPMPGFETTGNPYSEKLFEASPLNRIRRQAAPGNDWALNAGREIKMGYDTNTAADDVKMYKAATVWNEATGVYDASLSSSTYANWLLYKNTITDENDRTTEEFKDKEGRTVLKRSYDAGIRHDTYYVYDQFGNLTYVFPPLADNPVAQLNDLCYQYKYDRKNRLAEKKLPGRQWEYLAYDKMDRLVATGPSFSPFDGSTSGWLITKYDALGRTAYTGWYQNSASRKALQDQINASANLSEARTAAGTVDNISIGYTNLAFPTSGMKLLSISYYDDYSFPNAPSSFPPIEGQAVFYNATVKPKGLFTGQWNRVLENSTAAAGELSTTLYDAKARPISVKTANYLGGYTIIDSKLDFAGKVLYKVTRHKRNENTNEIKITEKYKYTDQDRGLSHTHQIGTQEPEQLIALNSYDPLGRLASKKVGGTDITGSNCLQKIDYSYNIRGWLTAINSVDHFDEETVSHKDLFAFSISYNDVSASPDNGLTSLYNGNIAETRWMSRSDSRERSYTYRYDALNRLRSSSYFKNRISTRSYDETMEYDKNGNIQRLNRNGDLDYDSFTIEIDDLGYTYGSGNQLKKVKDYSIHPAGFKDGVDMEEEYRYDGNGNMIADENKGITSISYNHMDLPIEISFKTGEKISYLYDTSGKKLKKTVWDGAVSTATDYLSVFQYVSGKLDFFPTAEGYVKCFPAGGSRPARYNYVFQYTDHLGNIRMNYGMDPADGKPIILEENHYYPFGMKHEKYNSDQYEYFMAPNGDSYFVGISPLEPTDRKTYQYKYQGQEWQDELGLNIYFFKYRISDPTIGRFLQIDPLADGYVYNSPYAFAENKVVANFELEGLEAKIAIYGEGATGTGYTESDKKSFRARATTLERHQGYSTAKVSNGAQLLSSLKTATAEEGSIQTAIIYAHGGYKGVFLDNDSGFYVDNYPGIKNSAYISNLVSAINAGQIRFEENAVIIFGSCNSCNNSDITSIASSITKRTGVTTVGATGYVYPEVENNKETGNLLTDGTFIKTQKVYDLNTLDPVTGQTIGTLTFNSKKLAKEFAKATNLKTTIKSRIEETNLGNKINPSSL